jgi:predicted DNA-binding transcriptional regulator YafY
MKNVSELARQAWAGQRVLRIRYQKPEDCVVSEREVEIYRWDGVYIDAYCRLRIEPRTFRVDRILSANLLAGSVNYSPDNSGNYCPVPSPDPGAPPRKTRSGRNARRGRKPK